MIKEIRNTILNVFQKRFPVAFDWLYLKTMFCINKNVLRIHARLSTLSRQWVHVLFEQLDTTTPLAKFMTLSFVNTKWSEQNFMVYSICMYCYVLLGSLWDLVFVGSRCGDESILNVCSVLEDRRRIRKIP